MKNVLVKKDFEEITGRINSLNTKSPRRWGKMNLEQMLAHCSDQVRLALGQKEPHEKPTFINQNIMKYFGLWLPRIPLRNLKAPADMNQQFFGSPSADIETEKTKLLNLLNAVIVLPADYALHPHPMYGKLNRRQWGRFMYVHIDHHLRQFSS